MLGTYFKNKDRVTNGQVYSCTRPPLRLIRPLHSTPAPSMCLIASFEARTAVWASLFGMMCLRLCWFTTAARSRAKFTQRYAMLEFLSSSCPAVDCATISAKRVDGFVHLAGRV